MEITSQKSRLVAAILCWILGVFGAHRFYVGKNGTAIAMLLISLTGIGMIATGIWTVIDMIIILVGEFKDKQGHVLKDWNS